MNKVHYSSKTSEWSTPQDFFDNLNKEFNFTLDPCATVENAKCKKFFTLKEDGLKQNWNNEIVFCNPPYGVVLKHWVKKSAEARGGIVVLFIPARTDTKYFHEYIYNKAEIRFIKGRIRFGGFDNYAPFPSMVVVFKSV